MIDGQHAWRGAKGGEEWEDQIALLHLSPYILSFEHRLPPGGPQVNIRQGREGGEQSGAENR